MTTSQNRSRVRRRRFIRRTGRQISKASSAAASGVWSILSTAALGLDHSIFLAAPAWGAKRLATRRLYRLAEDRARVMSRAFLGAESDRITSGRWLTSRLSVDSALEEDLPELRERCEALYRSDVIAHSAVEGRVANEIGTGLVPQAALTPIEIEDPELRKAIGRALEGIAQRWSAAGVDRTGRESLSQVQKLADRTFAVCGEVFILLADVGSDSKPIPLTLEVISPARVETPPGHFGKSNVRMGIEYSDNGRVIAYHVRKTHPGDTRNLTLEYDRIDAFDKTGQPRMLHVFDALFPNQSRGIPWMAAALQRIKDVGDVVEYEIIAKQVEACFTAFISGGSSSPAAKAAAASGSTDSSGRRHEELRPGAIDYLEEGEEIHFATPQRPGATFFPLIEYALRSISGALNYPYELLASNFFRTTFSAGRLSMLAGRVGFRMRRRVLVEKMLVPIWQRLVFEAVLVGELDTMVTAADYRAAPWIYSRVRWQEPGWSYIDPEKETKANALGVETEQQTLLNIISEGGGDLENHFEQRFREKEALLLQSIQLRVCKRDLEKQYKLEPETPEPTPPPPPPAPTVEETEETDERISV